MTCGAWVPGQRRRFRRWEGLYEAATDGKLSPGIRIEKDFVSWGAYLAGMGAHGATTSSIFHCGRGDGQPYGGGRATAAHVAAVAEPADPGLGVRGWGRTAEPRCPRRGVDRIGP